MIKTLALTLGEHGGMAVAIMLSLETQISLIFRRGCFVRQWKMKLS